MIKIFDYTLLCVLCVDLLATSGDITMSWTSPVFPKIESNGTENPLGHPVTSAEESWIGSLLNIGAIIGPFPFGYISEKFGRKIALLCIAIPHISSYLTLAFAQSVPLYYFARILGGLSVGGGYTLLPMYLAEISEDSNRGMLSVTLNIFWTLGSLISYLIGPYVSIKIFNIILACVPVAFFLSFLFVATETPYYYIKKNDRVNAEKCLMKLRSKNKDAVQEEIRHIEKVLSEDEHGHYSDLVKTKGNIKALIISLILIIGNQTCGINAITFNTQSIFSDAGTPLSPDLSSIIIGLVFFLSSIIIPFFADNLGRKPLLIASNIGVFITHGIFGVYFYLKDKTDIDTEQFSWLPIVSLIGFIITFNLGVAVLPWTISAELFPQSVKAPAASVVSTVCYAMSFIITQFFNDMNDTMGRYGTFWFYGTTSLIIAIFVYFYVPETKKKSFKEIQEMLEGKIRKNKIDDEIIGRHI